MDAKGRFNGERAVHGPLVPRIERTISGPRAEAAYGPWGGSKELENVLRDCPDGRERAALLNSYYRAVASYYGEGARVGKPRFCGVCKTGGGGLSCEGCSGPTWCERVERVGENEGEVGEASVLEDADVLQSRVDGPFGLHPGSDSCTGAVPVSGDTAGVRGVNWKRNQRAKKARKERKLSVSEDASRGLWNSCSDEVRQKLVESKAMMHIAENERRARVAREEVARMDSPVAIISRAVEMIELAGRCAKKENNSKVAGWAKTVATDYAESIAKSAPSTLRSYASVLSGAGSSTSKSSVSVDGLKRPKPKFDLDFFRVRLAAANGQLEVQDLERGLERCEITPAQLKYAKALCGAAEQKFIDYGYSYH